MTGTQQTQSTRWTKPPKYDGQKTLDYKKNMSEVREKAEERHNCRHKPGVSEAEYTDHGTKYGGIEDKPKRARQGKLLPSSLDRAAEDSSSNLKLHQTRKAVEICNRIPSGQLPKNSSNVQHQVSGVFVIDDRLSEDVHALCYAINNLLYRSAKDSGGMELSQACSKENGENANLLGKELLHLAPDNSCCLFAQAHPRKWQAIVVDWSPGSLRANSQQPFEILQRISSALPAKNWIESWDAYCLNIPSQVLEDMLDRLALAKTMLNTLKRHFNLTAFQLDSCTQGLDDYTTKIQAEWNRRHSPVSVKFEVTDMRISSGPKNQQQQWGSYGESQPRQQKGTGKQQCTRAATPTEYQDGHDEASAICIEDDDTPQGEIHCEELNQLSEADLAVLAGWCRFGQQGETESWIKTFCIIFASAIIKVS